MNIFRISQNGGLVKQVLIFLVILLVLAYFGLNLRNIVNSPTFQDNWAFIKSAAVWLWDNALKYPVTFAWNIVIRPLLNKALENPPNLNTTTSTSTPAFGY